MESNPHENLQRLTSAYFGSRCLHVVARLGIADALGDTPRSVAHLAAAVGANEDALYRILRLLASLGVFELSAEGLRHTAASRLLRADHPQSMRDFVRMIGGHSNWAVYEHLEDSVRTGRPAADEVLPGGFWAYFAAHPEESAIFNGAMAAKAGVHVPGIVRTYDFSSFTSIADIAGGRGHLLRAMLDAAPRAKGVLFDLPHVIEESKGLASPRLSLRAGDFFKDALPTSDLYVLMEIIHDWADPEALAILRAVRRASPAHAKLLLIETLVLDDPGPDWAKALDVHMLVLLGGRQRTVAEYTTLLDAAGFALQRTLDTGVGISILEALAAP